jgi:hypothetical protein
MKQVEEQKKRNEEIKEMTELIRDFLDPADFYKAVQAIDIDFFCGVPDSLLKGIKICFLLLLYVVYVLLFFNNNSNNLLHYTMIICRFLRLCDSERAKREACYNGERRQRDRHGCRLSHGHWPKSASLFTKLRPWKYRQSGHVVGSAVHLQHTYAAFGWLARRARQAR